MHLVSQNPLMSLVRYEGQDYYTSQYFHAMYRGNAGKKYKLIGDFTRLIRAMEAFDKYVERRDIVELDWKSMKDKTDGPNASLKSAFVAAGYQPLMLINATAQVALLHHLDDEVSKQASVAVNEQAVQRRPNIKGTVAAYFDIMERLNQMPGANPMLMLAHTLTSIERATGLPMEDMRRALPGVDAAKIGRLNATAVGKLLGLAPVEANRQLMQAGLQARNGRNEWELTAEGAKHAEMVPYSSQTGHDGYQILWNPSVADVLRNLNNQQKGA